MKIKEYEIALENCEGYTFRADDIDLRVENLGLNCWGKQAFWKAKHILLEISANAEPIKNDTFDGKPWQKRIDKDITQIIIRFENGRTFTLWPNWSNASEYVNIFEKDQIDSEKKTYYFVISATRTDPRAFDTFGQF